MEIPKKWNGTQRAGGVLVIVVVSQFPLVAHRQGEVVVAYSGSI